MAGHLKILAIEDDQDLAALYEDFLSWEGHDVLLAHDGKQALRMLRERPDVILLDLRLPDTDGAVLLRRLRGEIGTQRTPVIIVSATVAEDQQIRDADAVVAKPFDISELLGAIYRVTRHNGHSGQTHPLH